MDQSINVSNQPNKIKFILKSKPIIPLILILGLAALGFYFGEKFYTKQMPKPPFISGYRLVNEKISKSAPISIYLPYSIDKNLAQKNTKFDPEIEGEWLSSDNEKEIVFKPKKQLDVNHYYSIELTLSESESRAIKSDFLADEDPQIVAVFPANNSEAPEQSEITIVFNRPMVPLTTLGYLEGKDVPIEITPATKGRFKWISTRNLQFIPEERLTRSSNYKVTIKPEMVSMDGLSLAGKENNFVTRKLRYLNLTGGNVVYNQPISIHFNQPVDLEKIKNEISLKNLNTNQEIPFIVEYAPGSSDNNNSNNNLQVKNQGFEALGNFVAGLISKIEKISYLGEKKEETKKDLSTIQIYNKFDIFGREKFWDFKNNYQLRINKAYPAEGDIILNENRVTAFNISDVIAGISAESKRTRYASPDFFDPEGKLWVSFYEEIDKDKTVISVPKLKEIGYGEKCKDGNNYSNDCEKVPDKKRIYLIFNSNEISKEETLNINFQKITNVNGLVINKDPIFSSIKSYPDFKILKTSSANNDGSASLTGLVFCTNVPILPPLKEDYDKYFKSNLDYELKSWSDSWKIEGYYIYKEEPCREGEFHTQISYGLMPLSDYFLEINLEDVFGQKINQTFAFKTGSMPDEHLAFYHLQRDYNVTSLSKTKLTYAAENMDYINLEICKLKPLNLLNLLENRLSWFQSVPSYNCEKIVQDTIELPKKYWIKNYFQVDLKDYFNESFGHYILTFSNPNYKYRYWDSNTDSEIYKKVYEKTYLTITNLAVAEKKIMPEYSSYGLNKPLNEEQLSQINNLYWVTEISSLEPVFGAKIDLYQQTAEGANFKFNSSYFTDQQGVSLTKTFANLNGAVVTKDQDSTIIPSYQSNLQWASELFTSEKFYIYTDKPIYRPDQKVFIKGIYRIGYDGNYEIYQDKKIKFKIFNPRNDEVLSQDLNINDFGTFDTDYMLPLNSPLGNYRVCINESDHCVYDIYFDVEEYVPAAFEVSVKSDKEEYISKDKANLEVNAKYYFGVPLEGGEVEYTIASQNYYFDRYAKEYFNFNSYRYNWYYEPYYYGDRFILRGKASLDSQGKATIVQPLDFESLFKDETQRKSKIIVFDLTVKNNQGQSISAQKSIIVHAGEFYLGLKTDKSFLGKNEKFNVKIKTVDTQGKEVKKDNITLGLYKTDWVYSKRQEAGGGYGYQWEEKRDLVKEYYLDTDNNGNYSKELQIEKEGEYQLEVKARDKKNNLIFSSYNLYVYGEGTVNIKPTQDTQLELESDKSDLNVGEQGSLIIKSPYQKSKALIAIERGKIFEYQIKEIQGNLYNYNFSVKEEYLPNVFVSVLLQSNQPEIKFGKFEFKVNTKQKELTIEVNSNKKNYLPGEDVTLDILAKDFQGNPVSSELSVAVTDLSVLALKGNPKKNPIAFFYDGFPLTVITSSNLKNILTEIDLPSTKGGGGAPEASLAVKKRGIFKETAFWEATITTDKEGKAQVKFTLPDNLTTWQVEALGLTKDTKLGIDYQEFISRKELMVVPLKPRFIVPGDDFYIGAQIFNQSQEKQNLKVTFESLTLSLMEEQGLKEIKIDPGKSETVYFKVKAGSQFDEGQHIFVLSAKSNNLEDTVEQSIKIVRNDTYEVTATSNYTASKSTQEYVFLPDNIIKDKGKISIRSSATLAVFLSDALNYLLGFPYGCSEQIASKLDSIAIIKKGLNLPNFDKKFQLEKIKYDDKEYTLEEAVDMGLSKLYNNQKSNGGFSFWTNGNSDFYLTLHVADTLQDLASADFKINQNSLDKTLNYLKNEIRKKFYSEDENSYRNRVIITYYTLSRSPNFKDDGFFKNQITGIIKDDLFINEQISNTSLAYLAISLTKGFDKDLKDKVFNTLSNKIDIDSRGAFLKSGKSFLWRYYETPTKNTALYLKALVADNNNSPVMDKILRWILNSRQKDGAWGSTNNTVTVIDALTDFLQWKRETESNFTLELLINDQKINNFEFKPDTILDQLKDEKPLKDLKFNEINAISFLKTNNNDLSNNLYYDIYLKYYLPADQIAPRDEGFSIEREFYEADDKENENPLASAKVGDVLRVRLKIIVPEVRNFVAIEDFIPAGMEIVNLDLATEQKSLLLQEKELQGRELYPTFKEIHDDRAFIFSESLYPGVYEFDYYVRALIKGKFTHLPAVVSEMYFPENFGRTAGSYFEIN
ncbi:MAG: MG2 domain-containing protein [Candidatus Nealsonbacteria bacterium]|nr:MG2 domain-containing protein [Candidatus Nealsonbacteria bacterium]